MIDSWSVLGLTLAAFGLAYIMGQSKITQAPREMVSRSKLKVVHFMLDLIECPACFGFWIGLGGALLNGWGWRSIVAACYICASNLLLWSIVVALNRPEYSRSE